MKPGTLNAERLLALYERVADAPDAIARLRRFVLDLAVRGKLSAGLGQWKKATLGDIGRWGSGGTPTRTNPDYYGGTIPWLVIGDLNDGLVTEAQTHITEKGLENSSAKLIEPGTVLIAMYGSIGKLGIAGIRCATNQAIAHCVPDSKRMSTEYLVLLLQSLRDQLFSKGQGVAQQNISQKILKSQPIQVPPLAGQRRIVAKVEELMALLERLEAARTTAEANRERLTAASLARLTGPDTTPEAFPAHARFTLDALPALTSRPDQIKALRQTILNLAVRGKLVEQDSNDEPASELLKRIEAEKTRLVEIGEIRKQKLPAPVLPQERPFSTPMGWTWARLIEIGLTQTGTSPSSSRPELFGDFIPFVKPTDLDGATIHYDGPGLSREGLHHSRVAAANTVMMVCIGATLGKVNITDRDVCFNQQINSLTPYADGMHRFVALALKSSDFQERAWARAGTGTLPILSKGKWELLAVPLPPIAEQHRIVAKVDALMALCDRLEAALTTADTTKQRLLESLLHEALTPAATPHKLEAAAV